MNPYLGYELALLAVVLYAGVVYALWRTGHIGADRTFSFLGPALMVRTRRGRSMLDRWGRFVRFWTAASDLGIALAIAAMGVILALLLFGAVASLRVPSSEAPSPATALGIPGINPIIPLGYGLVALIVGIVLHELSHGVVARSQKIGVKSLGILWCVIPVGAFVEQDDAEMLAAPRRQRDRVAAAGVLANFVLTIVFFVALSAVVASSVHPAAAGVGVAYVESNTPAANASIAAGDIIVAVNGTNTSTVSAFETALEATHPNETVLVVYHSTSGATVTASVTLAKSPTVATRGFLGVAVDELTPAEIRQILVWPGGSSYGPFEGAVYWLVLPLATLEPVAGSTTHYFVLSGPLAGLGTGGFWVFANLLYWLAWMNLLLGLSNALPLVPLDGGLLFRDFMASIAARWRKTWSAERLDAFGTRAVAVSSMVVLVLLVWQFVVPHLL
ncbi:MAG TPA: site-2 protease family protein [Thermoplasmata archaeon]|nr:site-2 protease family protein [Thermoplasmata archaeon]